MEAHGSFSFLTNHSPKEIQMANRATKKQKQDIGRFFDLFQSDSGITEAFFLKSENDHNTHYYSADDKDQFIEDVLTFNSDGYTCYAGIQPRDPALLEITKASTKKNIIDLCFLYLDVDPIRPKGTNATNKEKKRCLEVAKKIQQGLKKMGYKKPILTSSGNGNWLLMPIPEIKITDENRDEIDKRLKAWGKQMKEKFQGEGIEIDTNVHDLRRITKIPGTKIFNKPHTEKRPQRISKFISEKFPKPDKKLKRDFLSLSLEKDKLKARKTNIQKANSTPKSRIGGIYKQERVFKKCYLVKFLKSKGVAGENIPHNIRLALSTLSLAMGDLDNDLVFIKEIIGGCPNFSEDVTRYQLQLNQAKCSPYGCERLRSLVTENFDDFDPNECNCELTPSFNPEINTFRKISPIRYAYIMENDLNIEFKNFASSPSGNPLTDINKLKLFTIKYLTSFDFLTARKFLQTIKRKWHLTEKEIDTILAYGGQVIGVEKAGEPEEEDIPIELSEEDQKKAITLLKKPSLFYDYGKFISKLGVVKEQKNIRLILLALTSRLRNDDQLISLIIKGDSSAGKSHVVKKCLEAYPEEFYFEFSAMSSKALYFTKKSFKNKFIIFYEYDGQKGEGLNYSIRTLQTEGKLKYEVSVQNKGKWETQSLEKEGPTGIITTTTNAKIFDENETRLFSLFIDESEKQTKAVNKMSANIFQTGAQKLSNEEIERWKNIQRTLQPIEVRIPYAKWLADKIPSDKVRIRRDFTRILLSIAVCALLHQFQRERVTEGDKEYIIASPIDYFMVRKLLQGTIIKTVKETTPKTEKLVKIVKKLYQAKINGGNGDFDDDTEIKGIKTKTWANIKPSGDSKDIEIDNLVHITELIQATNLKRRTVERWLKPAIENGCIEKIQTTGCRGKVFYKPIQKAIIGSITGKRKKSFLPEPEQLLKKFPEMAKDNRYINPLTGKRVKIATNGIKKINN